MLCRQQIVNRSFGQKVGTTHQGRRKGYVYGHSQLDMTIVSAPVLTGCPKISGYICWAERWALKPEHRNEKFMKNL